MTVPTHTRTRILDSLTMHTLPLQNACLQRGSVGRHSAARPERAQCNKVAKSLCVNLSCAHAVLRSRPNSTAATNRNCTCDTSTTSLQFRRGDAPAVPFVSFESFSDREIAVCVRSRICSDKVWDSKHLNAARVSQVPHTVRGCMGLSQASPEK